MTHEDVPSGPSARSAWRGDAAHRKARATTSEGPDGPPSRSRDPHGSLSTLLGMRGTRAAVFI